MSPEIVISVGNGPPPNLSKVTESLRNLEPCIFALALTSASFIVPSTMLSVLTVIPVGSAPVASFESPIAALAFISASTIVPSNILADVTCPSLRSCSIMSFLLS